MKIPKWLQAIGGVLALPFYFVKLLSMRKKGQTIIVLGPKLGSTVYGMMYVKQFKEETNNFIVAYACESNVKYIESYGCVDKIITYKKNYFYQVLIYEMCWLRHLLRRKHKNKELLFTSPPQYFYHNRNALDIFKNDIFSVKENKPQLLKLNEFKVKAIKNFEENKDKIIVINSYSNSHISNCRDLLQKVANELVSKGFILYSNVIGKQIPLENTLALDCPIAELYEICNHIKCFITIRSGVVDFVAATPCEKIILYMKKNLLKICSISQLNQNIHEFEILSQRDEENFIEQTKKIIKEH